MKWDKVLAPAWRGVHIGVIACGSAVILIAISILSGACTGPCSWISFLRCVMAGGVCVMMVCAAVLIGFVICMKISDLVWQVRGGAA